MTILIDGQTGFVNELRKASLGDSPGETMKQLAESYTRIGDFVGDTSSLFFHQQYIALDASLNQKAQLSLSALQTVIAKAFTTKDPQTLAVSKSFLTDKHRIQDTLVALQFASAPPGLDLGSLIQSCRMIDLVERVGRSDPSLSQAGALIQASSRIIVLPGDLFPVPSTSVQHPLPASDNPPGAGAGQSQMDLQSHLAMQPASIQRALITGDSPTPPTTAGQSQMDRRSNPLGPLQPINASTGPIFAHVDPDTVFGDDPFHMAPSPREWDDGPPAVLPGPPNTHSQVMPAGIADLLVVREHVLRYEPGEIAYVENVAKKELLKRVTNRKETSESSTLTTTTLATQTEHDLQTSNRFDLQRQSQSVVNQSVASVPGVGSSEAYGPLVDSSGSTQQSSSEASQYGRNVTSKAVSQLTQSLQTQVLQRTTSESDENVEHDFDNSKGTTDEIVIYQWLDKISQAQVFSYGKRVLYDLIVPEPAAFAINALSKWEPELGDLQKPTLFPLEPYELLPRGLGVPSYEYYAAGYGATGVQPPPEPHLTIAKTYGNRALDPYATDDAHTLTEIIVKENVEITAGYQAKLATVHVIGLQISATAGTVKVEVGQHSFEFDASIASPTVITKDLNGEVGQITLVADTRQTSLYLVSVEILCVPTEQKMAQWQAQTHDTILQASRDRISEYEDRVANLKAAMQVKAAGKNSKQKQAFIQAELEKACISILSNQHFDSLNAIEFSSAGPNGVPQLFLPNVDPVGRYIRFFEQAFEWDQMMYRYYPYFWARKKYWNDRIQLDDQDPEFAAFLNSGAARVTLPVRRSYDSVVAKFMSIGEIPTEAELSAVTSPLYVPFLTEMQGGDVGPDSAIPYGDPWEVRVPTTLVKVRTDNTLPRWKQIPTPAATAPASGPLTWEPQTPGDSINP